MTVSGQHRLICILAVMFGKGVAPQDTESCWRTVGHRGGLGGWCPALLPVLLLFCLCIDGAA